MSERTKGQCLMHGVLINGGFLARQTLTTSSGKKYEQFQILLAQKNFRFTFVIDLTIAVDISLADHLVDLFIGQLLAEVGHHVTKFGGRNEPVAVLEKK